MFQYAFGRAASLQKGEQLFLDEFSFRRDILREYALEKYNIQAKSILGFQKLYYNFVFYLNRKIHFISRGEAKCGLYFESKEFAFDDVTSVDAKYFEGCWQNVAYFERYKKEIRSEFKYIQEINDEKECFVQKLHQVNSVAVHVRHGDYLNATNQTIYEVPDISYYLKAMEYMKDMYPDCVFFFFSDDMEWCKEQFARNEDCVFPEFQIPCTAQEDMYLMQQCKHYIIANSSFSWWAAWLSENKNATRLAPKYWFKNSQMNSRLEEAILKDFITI